MSMLTTPKPPKGYDMLQFSPRGGQSAQAYSQLYSLMPQLMSQAQGAEGAFGNFEQPAMRQFQQQIAPRIAQRYAGSGIGASSGMQNSLSAAGRDLTEDLAAQRSQLMQQSMHNVLSLGDLLLGRPDVMNAYQEKQKPWWQQGLSLAPTVAGGVLGGIYGGGPKGAYMGALGGNILGEGIMGF